ncbi:hypothetical protein NPIL_224581 [Nephila pilipes]|uniref:Uncharacterized protein n=1 Tax=Nephila pilipes TaxID=299642 RepID=A0A8X6Q0H0_NEPPI|nr:hypothetical protein NPIL_224581 [Nephila pilipes]
MAKPSHQTSIDRKSTKYSQQYLCSALITRKGQIFPMITHQTSCLPNDYAENERTRILNSTSSSLLTRLLSDRLSLFQAPRQLPSEKVFTNQEVD